MNSTEKKLERILGREDWQSLTGPQVAERARELEEQAAFAQKLMTTMWRSKAPTVGAVLSLDDAAEG